MNEIRAFNTFKEALFYVKSGKTISGLMYTAHQQILTELWNVFIAELVAMDSTEKFKT